MLAFLMPAAVTAYRKQSTNKYGGKEEEEWMKKIGREKAGRETSVHHRE
jgi:hypothetical protein